MSDAVVFFDLEGTFRLLEKEEMSRSKGFISLAFASEMKPDYIGVG